MNFSSFLLSLALILSLTTVYSVDKGNYVITKENDTIYYDAIEVSYYKRAVCTNKKGDKERYSARGLKKVFTNGDTYEAGRIVPLAVGWKRFMLLYRYPEDVKDQGIIIYSYAGQAGGDLNMTITTLAIRHRSEERGDFKKLSLNVRNKILDSCPRCTNECADIILNTPIQKSSDVYEKIIKVVNQKCSN